MEKEKTFEELKAENEALSKQIQDINEKVKGLGGLLLNAKECNVKLGYSIRLFADTHLTREEKITIAQEFDKAINSEQVLRIYSKYLSQFQPEGVEVESDFIWSPGFIRNLEKYYFKYKGYNPFEAINEGVKIIRNQFKIEEELKNAEGDDKVKVLKEAWMKNRDLSIGAIDDILSITNEILKK
jgi:hypothetical protein